MARLSREFYDQDTVEAARKLLGMYLVRRLDGETLAGRITETEAYVGRCDKACHAYQYRRTERTDVLFMPPGHAYIYLIYGMHHCLNLVTEPEGEPAAVLIRGIEPAAGLDTIRRLRYGDKPLTPYRRRHLTDGPGKVCRALGLSLKENRIVFDDRLILTPDPMIGVIGTAPAGEGVYTHTPGEHGGNMDCKKSKFCGNSKTCAGCCY